MNYNELEKYCEDGLSTHAISKNKNVSQTTVVYWLKKFGLKTRGWSNIDRNVLVNAIKESKSYNEVFLKLNKASSSGNYKLVKRLILKFNIDVTHFSNRNEIMVKHNLLKKVPNEKLFIIDSKTSRATIKKRIIKENLIKYKCIKCGQDEMWKDKKLTLILDHINGIRNDNRIENLRFVCPNCNSQLITHCRKK